MKKQLIILYKKIYNKKRNNCIFNILLSKIEIKTKYIINYLKR